MGATVDARTFREAMVRFLEALRSHRQPGLAIEVHPGGRPRSPLLVGLE